MVAITSLHLPCCSFTSVVDHLAFVASSSEEGEEEVTVVPYRDCCIHEGHLRERTSAWLTEYFHGLLA